MFSWLHGDHAPRHEKSTGLEDALVCTKNHATGLLLIQEINKLPFSRKHYYSGPIYRLEQGKITHSYESAYADELRQQTPADHALLLAARAYEAAKNQLVTPQRLLPIAGIPGTPAKN